MCLCVCVCTYLNLQLSMLQRQSPFCKPLRALHIICWLELIIIVIIVIRCPHTLTHRHTLSLAQTQTHTYVCVHFWLPLLKALRLRSNPLRLDRGESSSSLTHSPSIFISFSLCFPLSLFARAALNCSGESALPSLPSSVPAVLRSKSGAEAVAATEK